MKRYPLLLAAGGIASLLAAPNVQSDTRDAAKPAGQYHAADKTQGEKEGTAQDADNTGRNVRDRHDTLTPMDQGNSEADRTITQSIRQELVKNDRLSSNGKNIKIITVDGVVTLRGPVKSAEERSTIASVAQRAGGVKRVDNQLEIERNQ
jgi:osmotically-inducible protein OsmY